MNNIVVNVDANYERILDRFSNIDLSLEEEAILNLTYKLIYYLENALTVDDPIRAFEYDLWIEMIVEDIVNFVAQVRNKEFIDQNLKLKELTSKEKLLLSLINTVYYYSAPYFKYSKKAYFFLKKAFKRVDHFNSQLDQVEEILSKVSLNNTDDDSAMNYPPIIYQILCPLYALLKFYELNPKLMEQIDIKFKSISNQLVGEA